MSRSTYFSMLALSVAIWNFTMHRDISANMYIAAFLAIQGARYSQDDECSRQWDRIALLCTILSVAICLYSAYGIFEGFQFGRPKSW